MVSVNNSIYFYLHSYSVSKTQQATRRTFTHKGPAWLVFYCYTYDDVVVVIFFFFLLSLLSVVQREFILQKYSFSFLTCI